MTTEAVVEGDGGAVAAGVQLQQARQDKGLSQEQAAGRLHVPVHVIAALEQGQWEKLGAPVFIRGQLRSYARLLGVDAEPLMAPVVVEHLAPVALVSHASNTGLRRYAGGLGRRLAYVGLALVVLVPMGLLARAYLQPERTVASLDELPAVVEAAALPLPMVADAAQLPAGPLASTTPVATAAAGTGNAGQVERQPAAVVPSTARAGSADGRLLLNFAGDSWIDIAGPDGQVVEKALVRSGQQRSYEVARISRVVLGNATQVQASIGDREIDLTAMGRSNVARFTVSSDGSVSPVSR